MNINLRVLSILGFLVLLFSPMALAGDLIVGAATSRNVVQYDEGTGDIVGTFIESIAGPHSMTFGPDGNIYIVAALGNQIRRYKPDSGELIDIFISSGLNTPTDAKFGPDGNLYVLNFSTSNVTRFDGETGAFIDIFIQTGNGGLQRPENLAFGPDGNLYITDARTRAVHRFDAETGFFIDNFVGDNASTPDNDESGGLNGGQELIFRNSDRLLYVANVGGHNILRFDAFTGEFVDVFVTSRSGGLSTPHDIIFGADENLYVASQDSDEVLRYDGETGEFIDAFVSAGSGGIDGTWSMLFLPDEDSSLKISLAIIFIEPTLTTHKINIDLFSKKSFDISERRANFVFSIGIG